ncbi:MAG: tetratricopeptide repeat protein [Planctomycetia bacterium]|nr:tetratricopeptide repeat protein [Planctomycetia bacterium]
MKRSTIKTSLLLSVIIITSSISVSCVYFNTFYNAKMFFSEAEKMRAKKEGEFLGNNITDKYKKVIEKSNIVINNYPDSKYFDDALFLKGKAHYYRREYDLAEATFRTLLSANPEDYGILSEYWLALLKWKLGKPQPALEYLNQIIHRTDKKELLASIYQSQAEIFLELKQDSIAVSALEKAAELTKNRNDKGQIYYRLAELAREIQNYELAIDYYKNVIKFSYSNERILEANLKIVQRYRDLNDLQKASKEIQSMLIDPEFSKIHGDLELELAKLELTQNDNEAAVVTLEDIVVKYPKTEISAEAFYLLGEQSLLNKRDFVKADYYYKQIQRESSKSIFNQQGKIRIKELDKYQNSKNILEEINKIISLSDSSINDNENESIDTVKTVLELYSLGELEAFYFDQIDTSIIYFKQIINGFPDSELDAKAMYTLSYLYDQIADTSQSLKYKDMIVKKYAESEYAEHIRLNNKFKDYGVSRFALLSNAESLYSANSDSALIVYKNIADLSNSENAKRALLFIANEYNYILFDPDSAYKYYNQITVRFPESEQAKIAKDRLKYISINKTETTISNSE